MAPDTTCTPNRPASACGQSGIPLIQLVLSGALRTRPPDGERAPEPPRDD